LISWPLKTIPKKFGYALLLKTNVNVHGAFDQELIGRSSSTINDDSKGFIGIRHWSHENWVCRGRMELNASLVRFFIPKKNIYLW